MDGHCAKMVAGGATYFVYDKELYEIYTHAKCQAGSWNNSWDISMDFCSINVNVGGTTCHMNGKPIQDVYTCKITGG